MVGNTSRNMLYFAPNWKTTPVPVVPDFVLPPDMEIKNSPVMIFPVPCVRPPIGYMGTYTFAVGAFEPGTLNFLSNLATASFMVE